MPAKAGLGCKASKSFLSLKSLKFWFSLDSESQQGHLGTSGHFEIMSGDTCGCHNWEHNAPGIQWAETRDAAQHPAGHRAAPSDTESRGPECL